MGRILHHIVVVVITIVILILSLVIIAAVIMVVHQFLVKSIVTWSIFIMVWGRWFLSVVCDRSAVMSRPTSSIALVAIVLSFSSPLLYLG